MLEESISALRSEAESIISPNRGASFPGTGGFGRLKINKEKFKLSSVIDEVLYETSLIDTNHVITSEKKKSFH